jgi:hypothetical protein
MIKHVSFPLIDFLGGTFDQFGNEHSVKWYGAPPASGGFGGQAPLMHSLDYLVYERNYPIEEAAFEPMAFGEEEEVVAGEQEILGVRIEAGGEQSIEDKFAPIETILNGMLLINLILLGLADTWLTAAKMIK